MGTPMHPDEVFRGVWIGNTLQEVHVTSDFGSGAVEEVYEPDAADPRDIDPGYPQDLTAVVDIRLLGQALVGVAPTLANHVMRKADTQDVIDLLANLTTAITPGSVIFVDSGSLLAEDNANLFWDNVAKELGINTNTPGAALDVQGPKTGDIVAAEYDAFFGDAAGNAGGAIQIGGLGIGSGGGMPSVGGPGINLNGAAIIRNMNTPENNADFIFYGSDNNIRFGLAMDGVGKATYSSHSMIIAGPSEFDNDIFLGSHWGFDLAMNTAVGGADLGVQNDLQVLGESWLMGSVGIGTIVPEWSLEVEGASTQIIQVKSSDGGTTQIRLKSDSTNRRIVALNNSNAVQSQIEFFDSGEIRFHGPTADDRITFDASGNVGVNIVTPDTLLHLWASSAGTVDAVSDALLTLERAEGAFISFLADSSISPQRISGLYFGSSTDNDDAHFLYTTPPKFGIAKFTWNVGDTDIMQLTQVGLFIGTSLANPTELLDVAGDTRVRGRFMCDIKDSDLVTIGLATADPDTVNLDTSVSIWFINFDLTPDDKDVTVTLTDGVRYGQIVEIFSEPTTMTGQVRMFGDSTNGPIIIGDPNSGSADWQLNLVGSYNYIRFVWGPMMEPASAGNNAWHQTGKVDQ